MAEIIHSNKVCGISENTNMPVMDDKYFQNYSAYEKCKCINKLKSSLEILAKNKGYGYLAYVEDYKKKYENKVDENYVETNLEDIYSSTTKEDKERIESQSIKERNQRILIAVGVFVFAIGMISIYSTRNS